MAWKSPTYDTRGGEKAHKLSRANFVDGYEWSESVSGSGNLTRQDQRRSGAARRGIGSDDVSRSRDDVVSLEVVEKARSHFRPLLQVTVSQSVSQRASERPDQSVSE